MKRPLLQQMAVWEPLLMAVVALAGMAAPRLLPVAVALAALLTAVRWADVGHPFPRTPADWPVVLLVLLIPVGWWAAADPKLAAPHVMRLLLGVSLFYSMAGAAAGGRGPVIGAGFTAIGAVLALAVPFASGLAGNVNANVLAGALLLPLAFPLTSLLFNWGGLGRPVRLMAALSAAIMLAALLWLRSRGALIGLAALLLALATCRWRRGWLLAVLALAGAGTAILVMGSEPLFGAGLETRAEIWSRALHMLQEFPITGIGMGNFERVNELLYPLFLVGSQTDLPHSHNLFFQVGLDLGLAGLVAWLAIYFLAIIGAYLPWRRGRANGAMTQAALGVALLGGQVAVGVHGLLDAVLWGTGPALLLWAAWGTVMGVWARSEGADRAARSAPDPIS